MLHLFGMIFATVVRKGCRFRAKVNVANATILQVLLWLKQQALWHLLLSLRWRNVPDGGQELAYVPLMRFSEVVHFGGYDENRNLDVK